MYILKLGSLNDELEDLHDKVGYDKGDIKPNPMKKDDKVNDKKDNNKPNDMPKTKDQKEDFKETARPKDTVDKKND